MSDETQALKLQWVYGVSRLPSNLVNLSDGHNDTLCYAAAHTAVIYDKRTRKQTFLQGHCNTITCLAASADRSLLITADAGRGSLLVFWDPFTGQPIKTLQEPHPTGVVAVAVSPDTKQMATLSAVDESNGTQEIALWDLQPLTASSSSTAMAAAARTLIPAGDAQTCVCYNQQDMSELMTNGRRRTYFWRSQLPATKQISYYSPPLRASDFHQEVGDFVTSVFVPGTTQAVTSTVDGDVVVWDEQGHSAQMGTRATDRRAIKVMRLHASTIHHLSCIGDFVVTGGADGLVRFFDGMLRLCAWFEELHAGPVGCVSFATKGQQRTQATMQLQRLAAPNFMVSTLTGKLVAVSSDSFNDRAPDNPGGAELLLESPAAGSISDLVAHPLRPELLLLNTDLGQVLRWDMVDRACVLCKQLSKELKAVRLILARDGGLVVLGCDGGQVVVLKGDGLEEIIVLKNTRHRIARLSVSSNSQYIAAADTSGQVLLFGYLPYKGSFLKWDLVGKYKAHYGEIVGLHFGEAPSGQTRLFSLGADKRLLEYDLTRCSAAGVGLSATAVIDVVAPGGAGTPCSMCFAPPMPYYSHSSLDTLLLIADDAYKIKAYNPDTRTACATYLGPTFGAPISKLLPFRSVRDGQAWLAYSTGDQVVGLIVWPLDGDPKHSMGVIAHPGEVHGMALSFDGRKLVTFGDQGVVNVWDVNTAALSSPDTTQQESLMGLAEDSQTSSVAAAEAKWSRLIGDPASLEELKDFFCYAQIKSRQQDTTGALDTTGKVPVTALPDLMRAAGYYPSAADIDSLLAHVRFLADLAPADDAGLVSSDGTLKLVSSSGSACSRIGSMAGSGQEAVAALRSPTCSSSGGKGQGPFAFEQQRQRSGDGNLKDMQPEEGGEVDFETFLCLYVNHRPVVEVTEQQVEQALRTLAADTAAGVLHSHHLLELLQQGGEAMGAVELQQALQTLTGADSMEAAMPALVDAHTFVTEVLGFEG